MSALPQETAQAMCCMPSWRKADWPLVVIVHVTIITTGEGDDNVAGRNVVDWCSGMFSVAVIENVNYEYNGRDQ